MARTAGPLPRTCAGRPPPAPPRTASTERVDRPTAVDRRGGPRGRAKRGRATPSARGTERDRRVPHARRWSFPPRAARTATRAPLDLPPLRRHRSRRRRSDPPLSDRAPSRRRARSRRSPGPAPERRPCSARRRAMEGGAARGAPRPRRRRARDTGAAPTAHRAAARPAASPPRAIGDGDRGRAAWPVRALRAPARPRRCAPARRRCAHREARRTRSRRARPPRGGASPAG